MENRSSQKSTPEDAIGAMKEVTMQVIPTGSPAYLKGKDKGNIHLLEEDSCERHVHFENEAELGAFDVRTTLLSTNMAPEDIVEQCRLLTTLRGDEEQSREVLD